MSGSIPYSPTTGVVVTGGGSGIGRATALALAEAGRPVAVWDRKAESAEAVADEVGKRGGHSVAVSIDVQDLAGFGDAIARSRDAIGSIGGLVHAAGIVGSAPIDALSESVWDNTLGIHLKAAAFLVRDLVDDFTANPGSAIVLISSIEAIVAHEALASYCAAKAGMLGLARSTAARLGTRGVRANCICPGFIDTPMFAKTLGDDPNALGRHETRIPLQRLGRPEDIGRTARFLLSDDAAYITAAEIVVDGGVTRTTF
jgi:NAD(P)-dependent dehydrogenase (short-subunit alcohol dehydrogenase family)